MRSALAAVACLLSSSALAEEDILVGVAHALSGPFAASGHRVVATAKLFAEEINQKGGLLDRQLRVMSVDDACGLEEAMAAAETLVRSEVDVVIGHSCSHASLLAAGFYEVAEIPMLTPSSTHPRLTDEGRRNVFRLIGRDDEQSRFAAELLHANLGDQRLAILHDGTTYGASLARGTRDVLRRLGKREVVFTQYRPDQESYADIMAELKELDVSVAYIGGYGPDAGRMAVDASMLGYRLQLIGGDGLGMPELWHVAGKAAQGVLFSGRPEPGPRADELLARLEALDGEPGIGGLGAYAALEVWAEAVRRTGSLRLQPVADGLRRGSFETVLGPLAFDDKGDLEKHDWQWKRWEFGTPVAVDPIHHSNPRKPVTHREIPGADHRDSGPLALHSVQLNNPL